MVFQVLRISTWFLEDLGRKHEQRKRKESIMDAHSGSSLSTIHMYGDWEQSLDRGCRPRIKSIHGIKAGDQMEGSKTRTKILYKIHPQNRSNVTNQWRMDRRYLPKTKAVHVIEVGWAVDEGWTADVNHKSNLRLTNMATKWRRIHHLLGPSQPASGTHCTHLFLGRPMVVGSTRFYF